MQALWAVLGGVITLCVIAGVGFAGWQVTMRQSGVNPIAAAVLLQTGTFLSFASLLVFPQIRRMLIPNGFWHVAMPGRTLVAAVLIALLAGYLFNGPAQIAYQRAIATKTVDLNLIFTLKTAVEAACIALFGWGVLRERMTVNRALALIFATLAMIFARR